MNPETLAPEQKPVICRQLSGSDSDSYCRANRAPEKSYLYDTQTETLVVDCVLDRPRDRYCFDVALGLGGVVTRDPKRMPVSRPRRKSTLPKSDWSSPWIFAGLNDSLRFKRPIDTSVLHEHRV